MKILKLLWFCYFTQFTLSSFFKSVYQWSVVGQINLPSQLGYCDQYFLVGINASQSLCSTQPNTNHFYARFIQGNIRMYQGCRSSLRSPVPVPPFGCKSWVKVFRDKNHELVTPRQEPLLFPSWLHSGLKCHNISCPHSLWVHREYLRLVFGLKLSCFLWIFLDTHTKLS